MKNTAQDLKEQVEALRAATIKTSSKSLNRIFASVNMLVAMYYKKYVSKKGKGGG